MIPNAEKTVFVNGLKIITESIPSVRSAAFGIMVGAGSGDELDDEAGLTHFIEHMAFKGTPKRSAFQIAEALDEVGGKFNAYTSKEQTMYYAVVLDKHLDKAIDVVSDIFINPLLKKEDIDMEKGVILEEINMYEDTPDELIHDLFAETILHGHPLGLPTIGSKESIRGFGRDSFVKYRERLYRPDNVIVSAAGNLEHKKVVEMVGEQFKMFSGKRDKKIQPEPKINGEIKVKNKKTEQIHLCLGVKGLSQIDDNRYTFSLMDSILGGSMSSRLFQEVREKRGLAYAVYSTSSPFRDFGIFYVYAGTEKKNLEQVIELILKEFTKMKKQGLTQKEFERAKEHHKGTMVIGLESTLSRMSYITKSMFYYDRVITIEELFEKIDKVSLDDIIKLAENIFQEKYLTLTIIGDIKESPVKKLSC
ncbi:MAG: putative Zn-dependent peptidase [Candidatus Saganbacteria bacterium]|uniref:Putative Zn-dependent peptidase n=1 Tax=Candidatus Saganbacteria bacterium TaxID=2575572 RepID=A0A833NX57_UNCSA|nr:MAG: putative Zn-dependent peptidase [Candidatus Saganbacteria bacterium]